jgi:hypothetical protein
MHRRRFAFVTLLYLALPLCKSPVNSSDIYVLFLPGTFAISNLGMFGVHQFDAILPYGMGSILAISSSSPKVVQLKNGHFGVQKSMIVTITCDHRHIYGADAAEFLRELAGESS